MKGWPRILTNRLIRSRRLRTHLLAFPMVITASLLHAQAFMLSTPTPPTVSANQAISKVLDPLGRNTPQGMLLGFIKYANRGDYESTARFLQAPSKQRGKFKESAQELRELKDLGVIGGYESASNSPAQHLDDGLPTDRERGNYQHWRAANEHHPSARRQRRAVAVTMVTLPGIKLLHEGQLEGRKVRPPVFLGKRPDEDSDCELHAFYTHLFETTKHAAFHDGRWTLCGRTCWPDNSMFQDLVAWSWESDERYLIVVNVSDCASQALVKLSWSELQDSDWCLTDRLSGTGHERIGSEMLSPGLYLELGPWGYHLLQCQRKTDS